MHNLLGLEPSTRLVLQDGSTVVIAENMDDGQWVRIHRLDDGGKPIEDDSFDLVHSQDIKNVLTASTGMSKGD
jgi:hypothetical protein